jgi:hypothetical protein
MMGMPDRILGAVFHRKLPDTREKVLKEIEETEKYEPKSWSGFMARNAWLKALKMKLEELNDGA